MAELIGASKKKGQRGSSFTPAEDAAIAKSWISASENPIQGSEQKADTFLLKVQQAYNETFKPANRELRSFESIKNRVKLILRHCTSFAACFARVQRQRPSGASHNDVIHLATAFYNGMEVTGVSEDCGKPFKYREAWEVLRGHEKFKAGALSSRSSSGIQSSCGQRPQGESTDELNSDEIERNVDKEDEKEVRPVGRRRAKEELQKAKYNEEKLRLASKAVAAEQERNKVLKRHYEIMLFSSSSPAECDPSECVEYFQTMRKLALEEIRKEFKKHRVQKERMNESQEEGTSQIPDVTDKETDCNDNVDDGVST